MTVCGFSFVDSISEELVIKSLKFADSYITVPIENLSLIKNTHVCQYSMNKETCDARR